MKRDPVNECAVRRGQLTDYLAGELSGAEAEAVRRHLDHCEVCRASARDLATTLDLARDALADPALAAELPGCLAPERRARLAAPALHFRRARRLEQRWLLSAAAAAVAVVALVAGLWLRGSRSEPALGGFAARTPPAANLARNEKMAFAALSDLSDQSDLSEQSESGPPAHLADAGAYGGAGGEQTLTVAAAPAPPPRGTAEMFRGPAGGARFDGAEAETAAAVAISRAGADAGVGAPPAMAPPAVVELLGKRNRTADHERASLIARLTAVRIPIPDFEGLTARQAVERLNEMAAASLEADDLRIAWADTPPPEPPAADREPAPDAAIVLSEMRKTETQRRAASVRGLAGDAGPAEKDAAPTPMDTEQRISLLEAIRLMAEHYGLESRIEDGKVIFFERPAVSEP